MMRLPTEQEVFGVLTVAFSILIIIALVKPGIFKFLRDKGTDIPSLQRQGQYIAMLTMTWGFMWQVSKNQLSDWYAGIYLAVLTGAQGLSTYLKIKNAEKAKSDEVK